ncbi:MAG: NAD-dependent epimerase/dehydratase family protein [Elusimicrobia bacterium]|nr:NAD-dependent epimerase/dehydratase family protein [Elusimicrobiota bacterium]
MRWGDQTVEEDRRDEADDQRRCDRRKLAHGQREAEGHAEEDPGQRDRHASEHRSDRQPAHSSIPDHADRAAYVPDGWTATLPEGHAVTDTLRGRTILITGGAGFIGSHLIERLAAENELTVYDSFHHDALALVGRERPSIREIRGDVLDRDQLAAAIRGHELVVHLAAIVGARTVGAHARQTLIVNLLGAYNCLEASVQAGCERVVMFSSSEVNGNDAAYVDEARPTSIGSATESRWAYAAAKLATEHLALAYHRDGLMRTVVIRPFNIYGSRQVAEGAVHDMVIAALSGQPVTVYGDGTQIRSWCHIDDFADAVTACLVRPAAVGEIFNIGNPAETVTSIDLARLVLRVTGSTAGYRFAPLPVPEVYLRVPSVEKARRLLGFAPHIALEDGIRRTVEWQRSAMAPTPR